MLARTQRILGCCIAAALLTSNAAWATSATISGSVTDSSGTFIVGAEVDARVTNTSAVVASGISDGTGAYSLTVTLGTVYDLSVTPPTGSTLSGAPVTGYTASAASNRVNFTLVGVYIPPTPPVTPPLINIAGTVMTSNGDPAAFIRLDLVNSSGYFRYSIYTDANGHYETDGVPATKYYFNQCSACAGHTDYVKTVPREYVERGLTSWFDTSGLTVGQTFTEDATLPVEIHHIFIHDVSGNGIPNILFASEYSGSNGAFYSGDFATGDLAMSDANGNLTVALWPVTYANYSTSWQYALIPRPDSPYSEKTYGGQQYPGLVTDVTWKPAVTFKEGLTTQTASPYTIVSASPGSGDGYIFPHYYQVGDGLLTQKLDTNGNPTGTTNLIPETEDFTSGEWTAKLDPDMDYYNEWYVHGSEIKVCSTESGCPTPDSSYASNVGPNYDYPQGNFYLPSYRDDGQAAIHAGDLHISQDTDLGVYAFPTCFLSGHVTNAVTGNPVADVKMTVSDGDNVGWTDANGYYQIPLWNSAEYDSFQGGHYSYIMTLSPPHAGGTTATGSSQHQFSCYTQYRTEDVQINVPVFVGGHVYGSDGVTPLYNMRVLLYTQARASYILDSYTDHNGAWGGYVLPEPFQIYLYRAYQGATPAHAVTAAPMEVYVVPYGDFNEAGSEVAPNTHLLNPGSGISNLDMVIPTDEVTGKIVDSNGIPISNAEVVLYRNGDNTAVSAAFSGSDGSYVLPYVPYFDFYGANPATPGTPYPYDARLLVPTPNDPSMDVRGIVPWYSSLHFYPPSGSNLGSAALPQAVLGAIDTNFTQNVILATSDSVPPTILSGPTMINITDTTATVQWSTNKAATGQVSIALHGQTLVQTVNDTAHLLTHVESLTSLTPATTYDLQVTSVDASMESVTSSVISFTTNAAPRTTPPALLTDVLATNVTDTKATITWTTDEPSTSVANYGLTNAFGNSGTTAGTALAHSVQLTGLTPNTTYYFEGSGCDATATYCATFLPLHVLTFTTLAAPVTAAPLILSGPTVSSITNTSAVVSWTTDQATTSGVSANDGTNYFTPSDGSYVTSHSIVLTGLSPSTTYTYQVSSSAAGGLSVSSAAATFTTSAVPDTTPPVITNVTVLYLSPTIAVVEWTTDEPTTGVISYGSASQTSLVASNVALFHQVQISGLPIATAVPFTIYATDTSGNGPTTATGTMQTTATADLTPPVISNVQITPGLTTLDVSWDTNEAATSVVSYQAGSGDALSALTLTRSDGSFTTTHNILLTSLASCSPYSIAVSSVDPSNNFAQSTVYTGTTTCPCVNTLYVPASDAFGAVVFEDNWPKNGDLDFNDQVVSYRYEFVLDGQGNIGSMQVHLAVPAEGAAFHNGIFLHLPIPRGAVKQITRELGIPNGSGGYTPSGIVDNLTALNQTDLVIDVIDDTRDLYSGLGGFINTDPTLPTHTGKEIALTVHFSPSLATAPSSAKQMVPYLDTGAAPYDLFISRTGSAGHEIHMAQYSGSEAMDTSLFHTFDDATDEANGVYFVNSLGMAFALNLPLGGAWLQEKVSIDSGFPGITNWAGTGGTQSTTWWNTGIDTTKTFTVGSDNLPPPAPASFEPDPGGTNVCSPSTP